MAYKVIDIYKDLPRRSSCADCGKPGCFAFATAVHLEGATLDRCAHLTSSRRSLMEAKIAEGRAAEAGPRESPEDQAAKLLQAELAEADLADRARRSGLVQREGPPEALEASFLGRRFQLRRDGVVAVDGGEVDVWVKVVLLMYALRATGVPPLGEWVAYRELPNTISKQATFEKWVDRLPEAFSGRLEQLAAAAAALGAEQLSHESAQIALRFRVLPMVPLLLLLWDRDDDFPARAAMLLDRGVLDYLDQEALTFLVEALMRRLIPG